MTDQEQIDWEKHRIEVEKDVAFERGRQLGTWDIQRHDLGTWLKILMEEVGEMSKAMLVLQFDKADNAAQVTARREDIYAEAIQVASVASAIAQFVERGEA